jgi:serine/threonine protein phosphatase PrpC
MKLRAYAAQTHQGPYLQVNEDGYDFDFEQDLFMVLDGFGGSGVGDRAVERLRADIKEYYGQLSRDPNATMPLYFNPRNLIEGNAVLNALMNAHLNLLKANHERPVNQRAGASALVAARAESVMVLVGIGNCSAWHFRQGKVQQVLAEDDFRMLSRTSTRAFPPPPMNALGMYPEMGHQLRELRLAEGDKLLLLTDGAAFGVEENEILYLLNKQAPDASSRLSNLLKLSNSRGNLDNQTAMLLEF